MEENEKKIIAAKGLLLIILTIAISIFAWFFYGVVKVNAATFDSLGVRELSYDGQENNWNNVTDLPFTDTNTIVLNGISRRKYIIYETYNFSTNNMYSWTTKLHGVIVYDSNDGNSVLNWGTNNIRTYTIDTNNNEVNLNCEVTGQQQVDTYNGFRRKTYDINVSCKNIKFAKNMIQFRIDWEYPKISGQSGYLKQQSFTLNSVSEISVDTSLDTSVITSNNDANTEKIINNNDENTQEIIDNQNQNTEKEIESQKVCKKNEIKIEQFTINGYINSNGTVTNYNGFKSTDYIEIKENEKFVIENNANSGIIYTCFYNSSKTKISCKTWTTQGNGEQTLPSETSYIRISKQTENDIPKYYIESCQNGNQALNESIWDFSEKLMNGENWEHEDPDETAQDELEDYESDLDSYLIDDTDISELEYSIDVNTNTTIWGIFNRLITGNQIYYTGFLTILFLGIIKLVLAR